MKAVNAYGRTFLYSLYYLNQNLVESNKMNLKFNLTVLVTVAISLSLSITQLCVDSLSKPIIELQFFKNSDWSLTGNFIKNLALFSRACIFIESGTYAGATVKSAVPYFKEIHTIELSSTLYVQAVEKFKNKKNVFLYNGDSANIFNDILPNMQGKIIFWLDGHFSGGTTARGETDTPILQELRAICNSGLKNSIILIDDVRCFGALLDYPALDEIHKAIQEINPAYRVEVMGDILIAYPEEELFDVSPIIKACTTSRLSENVCNIDDVLKAEQIIAQAQGDEKDTICHINSTMLQNRYSYLWYGLICMQEQRYSEAATNFIEAQKDGLNHWRIFWYLGLNAYKAKWYEQARRYLVETIEKAPFFKDALQILQAIEKDSKNDTCVFKYEKYKNKL